MAARTHDKPKKDPKKRSRNFDGCWTCRLRKIKCDCTRPVCLRCQRAKLECKGYDIVLAWAKPLSVDKLGHLVNIDLSNGTNGYTDPEKLLLRRNIDICRFPSKMYYATYAELNKVVAVFENPKLLEGNPQHLQGPFGVFLTRLSVSRKSLEKPLGSPTVVSPDSSPLKAHSVDSLESHPPYQPPQHELHRPDPEASIFSETDNTYVHYALLDSAKLTTLAIKGPNYVFSEQSMFHILYPNFFPNIDSDKWAPLLSIMDRFCRPTANGLLLTPVMMDVTKDISALGMSFMRVIHPGNPWDVHVLPFLKQLLFELMIEEFPSSKNWSAYFIDPEESNVSRNSLINNIRLGIMFMCFATSGFHRSKSPEGTVKNDLHSYYIDEYLKSSMEFRKLGITILDYHMDEYDNNSLFQEEDFYEVYLLIAMLLQINLDNLYGVFENNELIYAIGDFIVKGKYRNLQRRATALEKFLKTMFEILQIFYGSTQAINFFNYSIPEEELRLKYQDLNDNYDLSKKSPYALSSDESSSEDEDNSLTPVAKRRNIEVSQSESPILQDQPLSFTVHFNQKTDKKQASAEKQAADHSRLKNLSAPVTPQFGDNSIYVSYGIPKSLLQLFNDIVHLTNHKNVFLTKGVFPRNYPRICAETEDKILNWNVESYWKLYDNEYNTITNLASKSFISPFHEGLFYNVLSFYYALKVYFKRLIQDTPLQNTQRDIAASLDAMEKLMRHNHDMIQQKQPTYFSPSFWAILICGSDIGSESALQQRCRNLWDLDTFGKHNYWRSKQILYEIWKRRSEGEDMGFMDMIREWDFCLNLG